MRPSELSMTAWGVACLGHLPSPLWLATLMESSRATIERATAADLSHLCWALAQFERMLDGEEAGGAPWRSEWQLIDAQHSSLYPPYSSSPSDSLTSRPPFSMLVGEDWAEACWEAVEASLPTDNTPSVLSVSDPDAGSGITRPPSSTGGVLSAATPQTQQLINSKPPLAGHLSALAHSLALLGHRPPSSLLSRLVSYIGENSGGLTPIQDCQVGRRLLKTLATGFKVNSVCADHRRSGHLAWATIILAARDSPAAVVSLPPDSLAASTPRALQPSQPAPRLGVCWSKGLWTV